MPVCWVDSCCLGSAKLGPSPCHASYCQRAAASLLHCYQVIDEIQMLADESRGWAFTRALLGMPARTLHVCGDPAALPLLERIVEETGGGVGLVGQVPAPSKLAEKLASSAVLHHRSNLVQPGPTQPLSACPPQVNGWRCGAMSACRRWSPPAALWRTCPRCSAATAWCHSHAVRFTPSARRLRRMAGSAASSCMARCRRTRDSFKLRSSTRHEPGGLG